MRRISLYILFPIFLIGTLFWGGTSLFKNDKDDFNYATNSYSSEYNEDLNNPYIEENGFKINSWEEETSSVIFTLTIVGDWAKDPIDVSLIPSDSEPNEAIHVTANNISYHVINEDINEVEYGYRIENLDVGNQYTFYSLNNTGLAIENNGDIIDDEILIDEELNVTNEITFELNTTNNAYVEINPENSNKVNFDILKVSSDYLIFSIFVSDNWAIQDKLNLTIRRNKNNDVHKYNVVANLLFEEDSEGEFNTFYYMLSTGGGIWANNNNVFYILESINNSYLAFGNSSTQILSNITIESEHIFFESPYIENDSFKILNEEPDYSVKFQIGIIDNRHNDFEPTKPLNVTLEDNEGNQYKTVANYVSDGSEDNTYIYEITELEDNESLNPSTNYSIVSIDNEWLAVGDPLNSIDKEISIIDNSDPNPDPDPDRPDLIVEDGDFVTANAYILSNGNGFKIVEHNDTSVKYTITVENWGDHYKDTIDVRLNSENNSENNLYTSKFVERNGNEYTYEITGLDDETNYTFYSLENTNLAIDDKSSQIDVEMLLEEELKIDPTSLIFKTDKTKIPNYVWIILLIVLIIIITIGIFILIRILGKNKEKKINKEINNLGK